MAKKLTHLDSRGAARMVNVGHKPSTQREATPEAFVLMRGPTLRAIALEKLPKGEVLSAARLAGILTTKRTSDLSRLSHGLNLDSVEVDFDVSDLNARPADQVRLRIKSTARISAKQMADLRKGWK